MIKTLYSVLGVAPSATPADIDEAFNRLKVRFPQARRDTDEAARMQFLAAQQAYQTLSNPEARSLYDRKIAKAGIKVATPSVAIDEPGSGWASTRNLIIAGLILIVISGTWMVHARQKAREEKEIAERVLRLAEEERRRADELRLAEEGRRQASFEAAQQRQREYQERQFRLESERTGHQISAAQQNAERQAAYQRQREQAQIDQQARQQQYAAQAAERAAQQRIQQEKAQLRELCRQRYNRSDC